MLTDSDIEFLVKIMDKATITGIQANLKMGEVFIKLQKMIKESKKDKEES